MDITWYGLGCFRFVERGYPAVLTDPFDTGETGYELPRTRAEIVTVSEPLDDPHSMRWTGLRKHQRTIASPGEYEMGGLFITGVATYRDKKKGAERGQNIVYTFDVNDVSVCHLGQLGHVPTQTQIEAFGSVDVLLVPVGIPGGLTPSMASEVISLIEPHVIIPMQYKTTGLEVKRSAVTRFLKEMGIKKNGEEDSYRITSTTIPEETEVVLLQPQQD
jgi:L-ascorbate metabolism protein UlaG (beta-lactamase superfamily)